MQSQLGCAHFCCGVEVGSAMASLAFRRHYARAPAEATWRWRMLCPFRQRTLRRRPALRCWPLVMWYRRIPEVPMRRVRLACHVALGRRASPSPHAALAHAQAPAAIGIGATAAQRQEAARAMVPLLRDVKSHAQPGVDGEAGHARRIRRSPARRRRCSRSRSAGGRCPSTRASSRRWTACWPGTSAPRDTKTTRGCSTGGWWSCSRVDGGDARMTGAASATSTAWCPRDHVERDVGQSPKDRAEARDELLLDALRAAVRRREQRRETACSRSARVARRVAASGRRLRA